MNGIWTDFIANQEQLIAGLWLSIRLALVMLALGLPGGMALAMAVGSQQAWLRRSAIVLVEVGRGTPALVVLQLVYYGLPVALPGFLSAAIGLAVTTAAFTSEILRGGLQAVPAGEVEAASALGMRRVHILWDVVIPQGMRIALPSLIGFCIVMFQATSLAFTIAIPELMSQAKTIASSNFHYFNLFLIAAVQYSAITITAAALTERLERRLARHLQQVIATPVTPVK